MCFFPFFLFLVFNVFVLFLILMGSLIKYREIRLVTENWRCSSDGSCSISCVDPFAGDEVLEL